MPRIPRFSHPSMIPDSAALPAVSAVGAQGFLQQCAPVALFGTSKDAIPYVLLTLEQRTSIARAVPGFDDISDRIGQDFDRFAVMSGQKETYHRAPWWNGENLWVAVPWLLAMEPRITDHTFGSRLLFAMLASAA